MERRISIVLLVLLYVLLAILAAMGVLIAGNTRHLSQRLEACIGTTDVAYIYIHGQALDDATDLPLAGCTASLFYNSRLLGTSTSNASGYWGISTTVQTGLYELRFVAPASHPRITQVLRAPNVTDFQLSNDLLSCRFRVSPAGGQTGNFLVFCAPLVVPTPTATLRPTATWTPIPPTVAPPWTPGATVTPCWREPSPAMLQQITGQIRAAFPPPDHPLTERGFQYGFGWPMMEQTFTVGGEGFYGQLWTPFTILVRWPDGCLSVIDAATFQHGEWRY